MSATAIGTYIGTLASGARFTLKDVPGWSGAGNKASITRWFKEHCAMFGVELVGKNSDRNNEYEVL